METVKGASDASANSQLLTIADYEMHSRQVLPRQLFDVIFGHHGAPGFEGNTHSMDAYAATRLRPRVMVGVGNRKLSTTVLGQEISLPILIAPAGYHQRAHPDGELASARAAKSAGTVFILATASNYSIEEVAAVSDGPLWFQLYVFKDRGLDEQLIRRAEAAGYQALVVTVDHLGRTRERETRFSFTPSTEPLIVRTLDPARIQRNLQGIGGSDLEGDKYHANFDRDFSWRDLEWLRANTSLPIVIKGIQTAEDARLAQEAGVDAIVVSNHGGHASPDSKGTPEILPEVVSAISGSMEVYVDGGIRRGADVLKALALGARAVLIGRPVFWGLAMSGERGVQHVFDIFRAELDGAMTLCGVTDVERVESALVDAPFLLGRGSRLVRDLGELARLHARGDLTDHEFMAAKAALLATVS